MIITFVGHGSICSVEGMFEKVENAIRKNIISSENTTFYCGGMGDFDELCARVCFSIKQKTKNCEVLLITPYLNRNNPNGIKYDNIVYPPIETVPLRFAVNKRNRWMIDNADLIIAYVDHNYGGAHSTLEYAKRKKKRVINLVDNMDI